MKAATYDPANIINKSTEHLSRRIARLQQIIDRYALYRLMVAGAGFVALLLALYFSSETLSGVTFIIFLLIFPLVAFRHFRLKGARSRFERMHAIKNEHLARLNMEWDRLSNYSCPLDHRHPFANDLNLSGTFSLHRLMDTAESRDGSAQLLEWLSETMPTFSQIQQRQQCVRQLKPLFHFRDKLRFYARRPSEEPVQGEKLRRWFEQNATKGAAPSLVVALSVLAFITVTLFVLFVSGLIRPWFSVSLIIYAGLFLAMGKPLRDMFMQTLGLHDALKKSFEVLSYLERYHFKNPSPVAKLTERLHTHTPAPAGSMKRLNRLLAAMGLRMNPVMRILINIIFPYDYWLAYRLQKLSNHLKDAVPVWLDVWARMEALCSMAHFAWLNPDYTFPEISEENERRGLQAASLGHPLIPKTRKVRNHLEMDRPNRIILITGSNMSGKSTFLRTVGINLVLANAGSVVDARHFRTNVYEVFTCIKISDSLSEGLSYFYAEVKRLAAMLKSAQFANRTRPLFFLIDEIYRGTNNRERLIGSRAFIKALAKTESPGLISTHDLELTELSEAIAALENRHFQEYIENQKMYFDYHLRSGPCPTTNALKIMKKEGLPVT